MAPHTRLGTTDRTAAATRQTVSQNQILRARLIETPCVELRGIIQAAIEANPLLDLDESSELFTNGAQTVGLVEGFEPPQAGDITRLNHLPTQPAPPTLKDMRDYAADRTDSADFTVDLRIYVQQAMASKRERRIANAIVDMIDERGFFVGNASAIAVKCACSAEEVDAVLQRIQELFGNGIGARNEVEAACLRIADPDDRALAQALLTEGQDDLRMGRFAKLARRYQVSQKRITGMVDLLAQVSAANPLDSLGNSDDQMLYIYPDIMAHYEEGELEITTVGKRRPPVRINSYTRLLENKSLSLQDKAYINARIRDATEFITALDARIALLDAFAQLLGREERDFLTGTVDEPKPLNMAQVAEQLGVSTSTISRLCKDKYIQTDRGGLSLGQFFMKSFATVETSEGERAMPVDKIAQMVVDMVAHEDCARPFSDQQIADRISQATGVQLARRTVAKYRANAGIPNSSARRKR